MKLHNYDAPDDSVWIVYTANHYKQRIQELNNNIENKNNWFTESCIINFKKERRVFIDKMANIKRKHAEKFL